MVIRKNIKDLTSQERDDYVRGVKLLKASTDPNIQYNLFVKIHAATLLHPITPSPNPNAAHGGPAFLPWHRKFISEFEQAMQAVLNNPTFGLPYWDWATDATLPDPTQALIWSDSFMGGDGVPVTTGPFQEEEWNTWLPNRQPPGHLARDFGFEGYTLPILDDVVHALEDPRYDVSPWNMDSNDGFRNTLEGGINWKHSKTHKAELHNRVHQWVGGVFRDIPIAANDPVFFLHHSNVDRIWAMWQAKYPESNYLPPNGAQPGQNLNDNMWPWDGTFHLPIGTTKPSDVLNYQVKLDYQYQIRSLVFCHQGESDRSSIWYNTSFDGIMWNNDVCIENTAATDSLALAAFNDCLYCVHRGYDDSSSLWYTYFDGINWSGDIQITGVSTGSSPALAILGETLYCVHVGASGDGSLWYTSFNKDSNWTPDKNIDNARLTGSPALAEFNGQLYCVHLGGENDGSLWYISVAGNLESKDRCIENVSSGSSPALAEFDGQLYCVHLGAEGDGSLWYISFNNKDTKWTTDINMSKTASPASIPTLTVLNNKLYCIYEGASGDGAFWYTCFDGSGSWSDSIAIPNSKGVAPSIAAFPLILR